MDFKNKLISKEVIKHYKEGQIASWLGDEQLASREFEKSIRAIQHLPPSEGSIFSHLEELATIHLTKKDLKTSKILSKKVKNSIKNKEINIRYSLTALSRDKAEFRAKIFLPWHTLKKLSNKTNIIKDKQDTITDRDWGEWLKINTKLGYTAYFLLTYSDSTIFASITTHHPANDETFEVIGEDILFSLETKFDYLFSL
jgi:hypothetical protein